MIIQKMDTSSPVPSGSTDSEYPRTRRGRVSKPPIRYEPVEKVEDDYASEDYDSHEPSDVCSCIETDSDEDDDESDADENGNLDGFVVPDKNESDEECTDGESSVSSTNRSSASGRGHDARRPLAAASPPRTVGGTSAPPAVFRRSERKRNL